MTGVDTNILVRYLTMDDEAQFHSVIALLDKKGANYFISDLVLAEVRWVLALHYQWSLKDIAEAFERLLGIHNVIVHDEPGLRNILKLMKRGSDLIDDLITRDCQRNGCSGFSTFDGALAKRWKGWAFVPKPAP